MVKILDESKYKLFLQRNKANGLKNNPKFLKMVR